MKLPHLAARIFDVPLMVDQRKAATILNAVGNRFIPGNFTSEGFSGILPPRAGRVGDPLGVSYEQSGNGNRLMPFIYNSVAVVAIEGTLIHKGKWIGMDSGETSYEGIQAQVRRAARDDRVRAVVFEVDSYGGEVSGAFDTAEMILELSAMKPTLAILTDDALSAGYLLASAARHIVAPASGSAGSIGVITMHVDMSAALEAEGLKITLLHSGAHKADGNPYEALPQDVAAKVQSDLDKMRDEFAGFVGKARGKRLTKAQALETEAQYYAADEALARGLIDAVARPSEAFSRFVRAINQAN